MTIKKLESLRWPAGRPLCCICCDELWGLVEETWRHRTVSRWSCHPEECHWLPSGGEEITERRWTFHKNQNVPLNHTCTDFRLRATTEHTEIWPEAGNAEQVELMAGRSFRPAVQTFKTAGKELVTSFGKLLEPLQHIMVFPLKTKSMLQKRLLADSSGQHHWF